MQEEESFQISQLIEGVNKRGEKAQMWRIPHCVRTATPAHTQHSHDTGGPHPGNYAGPFSFNRPCSQTPDEAAVSARAAFSASLPLF